GSRCPGRALRNRAPSRRVPGDVHRETKRNMRTERQKRRATVIATDPEWERAKAARRNVYHDDGVQETLYLQKRFRDLWSSRMQPSPVDLIEIVRTLSQKK